MDEGLKLNLELINGKVQFKVVTELQPETPVIFDYAPPLGDGNGFLGLEMLLISFAGCVSTAIVGLLRRTGKKLSGYKMAVTGYRREKPLSLEKIVAEVYIESAELNDDDVQKVIKYSEEISPVWLAIKNNVAVELSCRLLK